MNNRMSDQQTNEKRENTGVIFLDKVREFTNDKGEKVVSLSGLDSRTCPHCGHQWDSFINAYPALAKSDPSKAMYRLKYKPKQAQSSERPAGTINAPGFEHLNQPAQSAAPMNDEMPPINPNDIPF